MKYMITGANGQLGSEWVSKLTDLRIEYSAYHSDQLDITDFNQVSEIISNERPGVVINCAGYTNVDRAESESEKAYQVNEQGVRNLLNACTDIGSKLVHYSTDYVFSGDLADRSRFPDGYPEDAPTDPVNTYGSSKRAGELVLEESGISTNWLLIRVSWLCGRYGSNFVKTMLGLGTEKDQISVVDDQTGSPTFTFDLVEKTLGLLEKGCSGIYHVSSLGEISWAMFAEKIFSISGIQTKIIKVRSDQFQRAAKRPGFSLLSNRKVQKIGLMPINWNEGLELLLKQLNENRHIY